MKRGIATVEHVKARCEIDASTRCWNWLGAACPDGTPKLHTFDHARMCKRTMNGPLALWNIAHGDAPPSWAERVFRRCGNRRCMNPVHLGLARNAAEIGEHQRRAGYRKGTHLEQRRAAIAKGHAAQGIVATPTAVVLAIRAADPQTTSRALARLHGLSDQVVSRIRRGLSFRNLPAQGVTP